MAMERGMGRGKKVLVVEDNGDAAFSLKLLLEAYGYDVAVTSNGEHGIKVARAWQPDFVLLDIGLPGMDGYRVSRALRADDRTASTMIIAMSAYDPEMDVDREEAATFSARLVKPVPVERLLSLMKAAILAALAFPYAGLWLLACGCLDGHIRPEWP